MRRKGIFEPTDVFKNAAHWRMLAEEKRTLAEETYDPTARVILLRIAADYDRLAQHADDSAAPDFRLTAAGERPEILASKRNP